MPTDIWWNVFYDVWNDYQMLQPAMQQPGGYEAAGNRCPDNCIRLTKIAFILRLYQLWNRHQQTIKEMGYKKKIQYLSNKIKKRHNSKGVWLYYLHRAYIYAEMHQYDEAIKDVFDGCIQHDTNHDTAWALYSILLCGTNHKDDAMEFLQRGAEKCPGSSIINQLSDKLKTDKTLSFSDIELLSLMDCTDDYEEKIDKNYNDSYGFNNNENEKSLMNNCQTMIKNRDGIPIIYFVLRVLYNIIQFPTNNKVRQLDIHQIKVRTNPYGSVTINILLDCGFQLFEENNKSYLLLRPNDQSNDIKNILYYGDIINGALLNIPILDLVQGLKDFAIEEIMSDYHHVLLKHANNIQTRLDVFTYFTVQNGTCQVNECSIFKRFYRNRNNEDSSSFMRKMNFFDSTQSSHVVFMQLLDEMHIYLYHSQSITQYQHIAEKELKITISKLKKLCSKRSNDDEKDVNNDEDEDSDDEDEDDRKMTPYESYLRNGKSKCEQYGKRHFEGIPMDHSTLTHSKFIDIFSDKNRNNDRYHTLENNNDNQDEYGVIESYENGTELNYWEWHNSSNIAPIRAIYNGLKEEMLNNPKYSISMAEWNDIEYRCKFLYKSENCRLLKANTKKTSLAIAAGIKHNEEISKNHLIVLFIWSVYPKLQISFKNCCRQKNMMETTQDVIARVRYIANFTRLLYECVWIYGEQMNSKYDKQLFYHCVDKKVLFTQCQIDISMPYSFTSNFAIAETYLNVNNNKGNNKINGIQNGIIVTYSKYYFNSMYFDLHWMSPYSVENEILTYCSKVIIVNIMDNKISMEQYTISNILFYYIYNGNDIIDLYLLDFKFEKKLLNMIETYMNVNINYDKNVKNKLKSYHQLLFEHMVEELIKINKPIFIDEHQLEHLSNTRLRDMFYNKKLKYIGPFIEHIRNKWKSKIAIYKYINSEYELQKNELEALKNANDFQPNNLSVITVPIYYLNKILEITFILRICSAKYKNNKNNDKKRITWFMKLVKFPDIDHEIINLFFRWKLDIPIFNINIDSTLNIDRNWEGSGHYALFNADQLNKKKINTLKLSLSIVCQSYRLKSNNRISPNQDPKLIKIAK